MQGGKVIGACKTGEINIPIAVCCQSLREILIASTKVRAVDNIPGAVKFHH